MNAILNLGKWIFPVPFLVFGAFHFMNAEMMAGLPPFGGKIMVYITGIALIAAAVSMLIGKMDKLAATLLAVLLLLFALLIHLPAGGDSIGQVLKDVGLAAAALMYANYAAKDNAVIG